MARFTQPAFSEFGYNYSNGTWNLQGGTLDYNGTTAVQPTFNGDPLFIGDYLIVDSQLLHFDIEVDFNNITSFGTGQYYMTLPYNSKHDYAFSGGRLHDASGGDFYTITGELDAGTNVLKLFSVGSNGRGVVFDDKTPITLAVEDSFHIAGTYQILSS